MNAKDIARFESKYIPEPNSGCWLWLGPVTRLGYGVMHYLQRNRSAHRLSYIHYKGPTAPLAKRGDQAKLARRYGIDDALIRRIKDRKVWTNIE